MYETELIYDLAIAFGAALGSGIVARLLKQPAFVGYVVAGIIVGPYALGLIQSINNIHVLATLGVVLLLFTHGIELSFNMLRRIRHVAILGGIAQILITTILGVLISLFILGNSIRESIVYGFLISLGSTMVALGLLSDRGETNSVHGHVIIGLILLQDLAAVFAMFILPVLSEEEGISINDLGIAFLQAALFTTLLLVVGLKLLPRILRGVALRGSRELFVISVIALCLGIAFAAYSFGLSAALGAFAVGLMISESEFAHQAFGDIVPLRDLFAALFFVSIGMLVDLTFLADNITTLLLAVLAIIVGKFFITMEITSKFGYKGKTAPLVGAGMIQVGEVSFVLGQLSLNAGVISTYSYSLMLGGAVITIILTPFAFSFISHLCLRRQITEHTFVENKEPESDSQKVLNNHVILCGYGRVGITVARVLERLYIPYVVIELDCVAITNLQEKNIPCVYGDTGSANVLKEARIERASILVLAIADPVAIRLAIDHAQRLNSQIDIIARAHSDSEFELLKSKGVSEVVQPEREAGMELARHILYRLGISPVTVHKIIGKHMDK
jgi:monovalent cation:H+ antiporter-2, CPA2 family